MGQNRAIQPDDVVAVAHRHLPPILLEIIFELDPKRSVIPHPVEPAINLARLENEPAPFAQTDDFLHPLRVLFPSHDRTYLTADHADETDFSTLVRPESLISVDAIAQVGNTFPDKQAAITTHHRVITGKMIRNRQVILQVCRI